MIPCRFCPRSRRSRDGMVDHLTFWHNIPPNVARNLIDHPYTPVPDWLAVALDERGSMLRQRNLFETSAG
jgi:hypothetical protein